MRVPRPGFICGIDVNIVAEGGASQTEGQLRDSGREGVGVGERASVHSRITTDGERRRTTYACTRVGRGGRGPDSVMRRPSFSHLFWGLNMRWYGMVWDGGYCAPTPSLCEDGEPFPVPACRPFGNMLTTSSVRPSQGETASEPGNQGRAVHFHGRLNKSSDGVCWFLDRGGCGEGEGGKREAARKGGENWLCSGGGLVLPLLLRWYSRIDRGWPGWMGCSCRGALRPRMDVAWRAGQIATGLLDRLRTQSADIAYALCGSGGEGIG